jgi:hypothetical protein
VSALRLPIVCLALAGCGRIGFGDNASAIDAGGIDAAPFADGPDGSQNTIDGEPACATNPAYVAVGQLVNRYKSVLSQVPWADAVADCAADGAYLWIVNTSDEAAAIDEDWMGITDDATEGVWLTVHGDPAPYLDWSPMEPDGGTTENCGRNEDTTFESRECTDTRDYACECEAR